MKPSHAKLELFSLPAGCVLPVENRQYGLTFSVELLSRSHGNDVRSIASHSLNRFCPGHMEMMSGLSPRIHAAAGKAPFHVMSVFKSTGVVCQRLLCFEDTNLQITATFGRQQQ